MVGEDALDRYFVKRVESKTLNDNRPVGSR
jgi:hypothetical protein